MLTSHVQQLADALVAECLKLQQDNERLRLDMSMLTAQSAGTGACDAIPTEFVANTADKGSADIMSMMTAQSESGAGAGRDAVPSEFIDCTVEKGSIHVPENEGDVDLVKDGNPEEIGLLETSSYSSLNSSLARKIRKVAHTAASNLSGYKPPPPPFTKTSSLIVASPSVRFRLPKWRDINLTAFVEGANFEVFFAAVILLNVGVMSLQAQAKGMDIGHDLNVAGYPNAAENAWPGSEHGLWIAEVVLLCCFLAELSLKLLAFKLHFFCSGWNVFDAITVLGGVPGTIANVGMPLNPSLLRLLRLLRFARVSRLARVIKRFQVCDSLRVIIRSISASAPVLLWASVIIFIGEALVGLIMHSLLLNYMEDEHNSEYQRVSAFKYFGTFTRAIITMTELTLGNYVVCQRFLCDNVNELYGHAILVYKMTMGFAVIRVVGGVFINETFKTVASDDELMVVQKKRMQQKHRQKMMRMLSQADTSGDDNIDRGEFRAFMDNPDMKVWLSAQEIDVGDVDLLFDLVDTGDGEISPEELCQGIARVKGYAKSLDVYTLMHVTCNINEIVRNINQKLETHMCARL